MHGLLVDFWGFTALGISVYIELATQREGGEYRRTPFRILRGGGAQGGDPNQSTKFPAGT